METETKQVSPNFIAALLLSVFILSMLSAIAGLSNAEKLKRIEQKLGTKPKEE